MPAPTAHPDTNQHLAGEKSSEIFAWGYAAAVVGALGYRGGPDTARLFLCWCGLLLAALGLGRSGHLARPRFDWLAGLLVCELIWLLVSQKLSILPGAGLHMTLSLAVLPVSYLLAGTVATDHKAIGRLIDVTGIIATAVFALAIAEFTLLRSRAFSVFSDANLLAAFCNAIFFPALVRWVGAVRETDRGTIALSRTVALLAVIGLVVTTSMAGFAAFVFGLILVMALIRSRVMFRPVALVIGTVTLSAILVYSVQSSRQFPLSRIADEVAATQSPVRSSSFTERVAIAKSAWAIYTDHAWYGSGPGTFKILYPQYRSPQDQSTTGDMVHDDYLQFLVEGGPPLLIALALSALALLSSLGRLARAPSGVKLDDEGRARLLRAGTAVAALTLFLHAAVNFIFYSAPLSLLAGFYLAISRNDCGGRELRLREAVQPVMAWFAGSVVVLLLCATLGLRSLFWTFVAQDCRLHVCDRLQRNGEFMTKLANVMIATQPSWYFARLFLAKNHAEAARNASQPTERMRLGSAAVHEFGEIAVKFPLLHDPYRQIADLLNDFPDAASVLPPGVSRERESLYREAIKLDPLDYSATASTVELMANRGAKREALALTLNALRFGQFDANDARVQLLQAGVPVALALGECRLAREMSASVLEQVPQSRLASTVVNAIRDKDTPLAIPGCGIERYD